MSIPIVRHGDEDGLKLGLDRKRPYQNFFLHEIKQEKNPTAPAIIFVPGFHTDPEDRLQGTEAWEKPLLKAASGCGGPLYILHWDAGYLDVEKLMQGALKRAIQGALAGFRVPGHIGVKIAAAIGGAVAAPTVSQGYEVHKVFKKSVTASELTADALYKICNEMNRPVVLIGHSLGARICLRTTVLAGRVTDAEPFAGCFALAPAITAGELEMEEVKKGCKTDPAVFFSGGDMILKRLYGLFRKLKLDFSGVALGFKRPRKRQNMRFYVARGRRRKLLGHNEYAEYLNQLLKKTQWTNIIRS